jgi:hypothetical protein
MEIRVSEAGRLPVVFGMTGPAVMVHDFRRKM